MEYGTGKKGKTVHVHALKLNGWMEVQFQSLFISELSGDEWLATFPGYFTYWAAGWEWPRALLTSSSRDKSIPPPRIGTPDHPLRRKVTIVTRLPQFLRNVIQITNELMDVLNVLNKTNTVKQLRLLLDSKPNMKITISTINMHEIEAEIGIMTSIVTVKRSSRRTQVMTVTSNRTCTMYGRDKQGKKKIFNCKIWKQESTWKTSPTCEDRAVR